MRLFFRFSRLHRVPRHLWTPLLAGLVEPLRSHRLAVRARLRLRRVLPRRPWRSLCRLGRSRPPRPRRAPASWLWRSPSPRPRWVVAPRLWWSRAPPQPDHQGPRRLRRSRALRAPLRPHRRPSVRTPAPCRLWRSRPSRHRRPGPCHPSQRRLLLRHLSRSLWCLGVAVHARLLRHLTIIW